MVPDRNNRPNPPRWAGPLFAFLALLILALLPWSCGPAEPDDAADTLSPTPAGDTEPTSTTAPPDDPTASSGPAGTAPGGSTPAGAGPTPSASRGVGAPTPRQTEGPYFKAGSPERSSLFDSPGVTRLILSGRVLTTAGQPAAGVKVDFWQADENGRYDNRGYRYRGHQLTDAQGRYQLETVIPGGYSGRTPHIHVHLSGTGLRPLTTQLYFPDPPQNESDPVFDRRLLVTETGRTEEEVRMTFDFVLQASA